MVVPEPPSHLTEKARAEWLRLAPMLAAIEGPPGQLLGAYCQAWARWVEAEEQVTKFGTVLKGPAGRPVPSPYVDIAAKAGRAMREAADQLGVEVATAGPAESRTSGDEADGRLLDTRTLAAAFGVKPVQITRWRNDGMPVAVDGGRGRSSRFRLRDCLRWYVERELQARGVGEAVALSPQSQRALLDAARREEVDLRLQLKRGELIEVAKVRRFSFEVSRTARDRILNVPDRLADELAATTDPRLVHLRLSAELREALTALSADIAALAFQPAASNGDGNGNGDREESAS